jgi:hypothetical protein
MIEQHQLVSQLQQSYQAGVEMLAEIDPNAVVYAESGWTVKDIVAHVTAWEEEVARALAGYARGALYKIPNFDLERYNAATYQARRGLPWEQVQAQWKTSRDQLIRITAQLPPAKLNDEMGYPSGRRGDCAALIQEVIEHGQEHFQDVAEAEGVYDRDGLVRQLERTLYEGMAILSEIDPNAVIYTDSGWTVKDLIAHLAAWDEPTALCFEAHARGSEYVIPDYAGEEAFNWGEYEKRRDMPYAEVYATWDDARTRIRNVVTTLTPEQLSSPIRYPAGGYNQCSTLVREVWGHQQLHFRHILSALEK